METTSTAKYSRHLEDSSPVIASILNHTILSSEEEKKLGIIVSGITPMKRNLIQLLTNPYTPRETHVTPLTLLAMLDQAKKSLVIHNMRLIPSISNKHFRYPGVSISETLQIGAEAIADATTRWDPSRGVRFSTFAYWRIRGAFTKEVRRIRKTAQQLSFDDTEHHSGGVIARAIGEIYFTPVKKRKKRIKTQRPGRKYDHRNRSTVIKEKLAGKTFAQMVRDHKGEPGWSKSNVQQHWARAVTRGLVPKK